MVPLLAAGAISTIGKVASSVLSEWKHLSSPGQGQDSFAEVLARHAIGGNSKRGNAPPSPASLDATAHRLLDRVA